MGNYGRTDVSFVNEGESDCKSSKTLAAAEIAFAPSNEDFLL